MCVSVNFGLPDLSFDFMSEKNCPRKYVLLNVAHTGQAIWIIFLKLNIKQDVSDIKIWNGKENFTQHFDAYIYNLILSDISFLNCSLCSLFWTVLQVTKRIQIGHM
jgi:hypothetical protein